MMSHDGLVAWYHRWLYAGGRPRTFTKWVYGKKMAWVGRFGIVPRLITLEVPGRKSGRVVSFPMVIAHAGEFDYVVSMLGNNANWVRNLEAFDGHAFLRDGGYHGVRLRRLTPDPDVCAPLLKEYLRVAPGARPHIPVSADAPLADFEQLVADYPIFQVVWAPGHSSRKVPMSRARVPGGSPA